LTLEDIVPQHRREAHRVIDLERRARERYTVIGLRTWPNQPAALAYSPWRLFGGITAFRPHILLQRDRKDNACTDSQRRA
jgi:hypothetical protein